MNQNPSNIKGVKLSNGIGEDLNEAIEKLNPDKVFYLFEDNTNKYCRPLITQLDDAATSNVLILKSGEENKNMEQVMELWNFFEEMGAGRNSCLVTIGGGMLTDLGGFAACTFKRGMSFINVPTTLLSMVDASVGGKTGVNYYGLKNEIGIIRQPNMVLIHAPFLNTLDQENFLSGFAEMLKAGLIRDGELWLDLSRYDLQSRELESLIPLIWRSVEIKDSIVEIDPEEVNERRSLNFGHTVAHALESLSLKRNAHLHHGYAVAYGMIIEGALSVCHSKLSSEEFEEIRKTIEPIYGSVPVREEDIQSLIVLMRSDKKNDNNLINVTMLEKIGKYCINNYVGSEELVRILKEFILS